MIRVFFELIEVVDTPILQIVADWTTTPGKISTQGVLSVSLYSISVFVLDFEFL